METKLAESSSQTIREEVRRRYGATARGETSSCGDGCCTSTSADTVGYSAEESSDGTGSCEPRPRLRKSPGDCLAPRRSGGLGSRIRRWIRLFPRCSCSRIHRQGHWC